MTYSDLDLLKVLLLGNIRVKFENSSTIIT
jgi:hypothetical protein